MRSRNVLEGIRRMMTGRNQDVEISEELTNAYFGNRDAWQLDDKNPDSEPEAAQRE
ncbi:hypothetical protein [Effusibacillus consociatus]|uniref:Uncharacterized protein n=1 Tax=Effusibacillus consociatus TaxID=1117041 RepID=A0ABV9PWI5_9BACL